jgi:hypothetical protein
MESLKEWALIARDLGFPMVVSLYLLWMHHGKCKELYDKMQEFCMVTKEMCLEIRGLRSDVRELYHAVLHGRMYDRASDRGVG